MARSTEWMERAVGTRLLGRVHRHTTGSVVLVTIRSALGDHPRQQGLGLCGRAAWVGLQPASERELPLAP
jgi:hypothetical protein